jgi:hypothetical protein
MSLNEQSNQKKDIAHSPENITTFSKKKGSRVFREIVSGMVGFIASIPVCFVIIMALFFFGDHFSAIFELDVASIIATVIMEICVASFVAAGVYWTSKRVGNQRTKWLSFIGAYIGMSCVLLLGFSSAYLENYYYQLHNHYVFDSDEYNYFFSLHVIFSNLRFMALVLSPVLALVGAIISFETMHANSLRKANIQNPKSKSRS